MSTQAEREYLLAQISNSAYKEPPPETLPGGWTQVDAKSDKSTGFAATAYRNTQSGEIIIAYRGTDDRPDIKSDLAIGGIRKWDIQFTQGLDFANRILRNDKYTNAQFTVTGHSLGGTLAQVAGQMFGLNGATFDPGGGANLVVSDEFKAKAREFNLPESGMGVPGGFTNNYRRASLVSNVSGDHVGKMAPIDGWGEALGKALGPAAIGSIVGGGGGRHHRQRAGPTEYPQHGRHRRSVPPAARS